jgi:hypothetical protein
MEMNYWKLTESLNGYPFAAVNQFIEKWDNSCRNPAHGEV